MIQVHDDVLVNPETYRRDALAQSFGTVDLGHVVFHGIALSAQPDLRQWFEAQYPDFHAQVSFFRQSPEGQQEPNDIHNDVDMGDLTAIFYLTPHPPVGDGTLFWRDRASGDIDAPEPFAGADGARATSWEVWKAVPARFNRCLVFAAPYFHSRAILENYGAGDSARLIQVLFARLKEST